MIGQRVSHYKILEKLGGGGMGVVYKAEDTKLKRTVALKFLPPDLTRDPEAKERFIHEAQAASALDHPNICNIHEVAETADGQTFIVMGCYEGQTLKKKIESGQLEINEVVDIATQVAQGLQKAHEKDIIHRDIKPANIMITTDGVVKIVDFGLAKLSGRTLLTKSGSTLGTAAYMSPEQARGEQVDQRTDIWSLGVVLYEMLSGKRPFDSEYEQALVYSILSQEPKPIKETRPQVPEAIEKICRRAMAKDAKERYQTVADLIADLEAFKSGTELSQKTRRASGNKLRFVYAGLVVVVLALALVGVLTFTGKGEVFDHVAVLPFQVTSTDSTHEALGFGMAEEVIARLVGVSTLNVPAIRSTMKYKGSTASYAEIARELGANALVDGSVQKMNNRFHVIVKLIEPSTGRQLWSEPYDDSAENILDLQSRIAQAVVRAVRVKVSKEEQDHLARPQKKVDPRAYELYMEARRDFNQIYTNPSKTVLDGMIGKLQRAIDIEPDNASYHAELTMTYLELIGKSFVKNADVIVKMKEAAETALRLDPNLAASQLAAGMLAYQELNFRAALSHTARALELAPGNSIIHHFRGYVLTTLGRFEEALATFRRSYEVDPVVGRKYGYNVGMCYLFMRRYDDAITSLKQWLPQEPRSNMGHTFLAYAYSMKGMHKEALAQNDSAVYWGKFNRPLILYRAGQHELASKAWKEVPFQNDYGKATWFGFLGQKDSAFSWLDRFSQSPSGEILFIRHDPWLDNLRDDPRFNELLRKMNLLD